MKAVDERAISLDKYSLAQTKVTLWFVRQKGLCLESFLSREIMSWYLLQHLVLNNYFFVFKEKESK
jgi:hypothetical protein